MNIQRIPWLLVGGLIAGLALGLLIAWVAFPITYVDTTPATLRNDFKDQYRILIASAYASTGDLTRAQSRLSLLGDPDPAQALVSQAQRTLSQNGSSETIRVLASLADALNGSEGVAVRPPAAVTVTTPEAFLSPTPERSDSTTPASMTQGQLTGSTPAATDTPGPTPTEFDTPVITIIAKATHEPTATPGALFALVSADTLCDPSLPAKLLQVIVRDKTGKPVPGVEIDITWNGGEEHFFTGLKPELGNGYADFQMSDDVVYALRLADASTNIPDITIPSCPGDTGNTANGVLRLVFQQP
jgi:hypothetical protein